MKIFSGTSNKPLAEKIAQYLEMDLGNAEIKRFSDGEIAVKYDENIRGTDVFIIQSTNPPGDNLLELLLMIDAANRASAKRITAVIPYFGYARQDRKDQPRVAISAKLVANLISVTGVNRVLAMDLHNPSIQGFFDIPFDHLYGSVILLEGLKRAEMNEIIVVAPDIGSIKRARAYANRMGCDLALVDKKRSGPNQIETVTLIGDIRGKDVVIVDDMIDTAETLCSAAELLCQSGAREVIASCTHPILSSNAVDRIQESVITKVIVSDTILMPEEKKHDKIEIYTSAPLFGEAIKRIHNEESISSLFNS